MIRADRAAWRPELIALLAAAALARLAVFYLAPNVHWPDEIYQALEPAHRLVFGTGAVAWEWTLGARSWLLPGFVAALMEVGRLIGDSHTAIDFPVHLFMAAAGCAPVACAYCWGRRFAGRAGGFVAGAVPALWVDSIYLSGHTLAEVLAADCLPVALYLGLPASGVASRARLWLAGAFLGLTFDLRYHLAAALAVAALAILWRRGGYRQWLALIAGACGPVLAMGLLDWATLGHPFQSIFLNLAFNVAQGGDYAGRSSWLTLIVLPVYLWHAGAIAMLTAAAIGTRRLPSAALVAIAIFATYSFVAHKEYRFIYPALVLIAILAGIGSAEILRAARAAWPQALSSGAVAASALTLFWLAISIAIAQSPIYRDAWTRARAIARVQLCQPPARSVRRWTLRHEMAGDAGTDRPAAHCPTLSKHPFRPDERRTGVQLSGDMGKRRRTCFSVSPRRVFRRRRRCRRHLAAPRLRVAARRRLRRQRGAAVSCQLAGHARGQDGNGRRIRLGERQ